MVEYPPSLDVTFTALSDATRRSILARLTRGEATVCELAEPYDISLNGVSKHLKVLEHAGLLHRRIEGRTHYCSLAPAALQDAAGWLEQYRIFWEQRLDALEDFLMRKEGRNHARNRRKNRASTPDSKGGARKR